MWNIAIAITAGIIVGFAIKHYLTAKAAPRDRWEKEQWDEFQETLLMCAALVLYGGFEILCFLNTAYAQEPHTATTRTSLFVIVSNLFTYKFTKSLPKNGVQP